MNLEKTIGYGAQTPASQIVEFVNLKLAARGLPVFGNADDYPILRMSSSLVANIREKNRLLSDYLPPCDERIQNFLNAYLADVADPVPTLPGNAFTLERHGIARTLSLPAKGDKFLSDIVSSYRVKQGVLHNPLNDRRTTKGSFHIAEGGLPIPADKIAVPKGVFARLLAHALTPPREIMRLPFTSGQKEQAETFVSLLLRPMVVPEVPGVIKRKSLEVRFFAPGNLVCNLDFVESIFGNAGDPYLPENDAALDTNGWTGHSGCVILAPHLTTLRKKDLGLPHKSSASTRQIRDGQCWENEDELYNGGSAFKITARDKRGVVVTLIADNYFGYCKKEIKTMISFSANMFGMAEEEHAGGALAFQSYDLGEEFNSRSLPTNHEHTFEDTIRNLGNRLKVFPEGYAIDRVWTDVFYLPQICRFSLPDLKVSWERTDGTSHSLKLTPGACYVLPSGYKVEMHRPAEGRRWRLVGSAPEGTFCHKPCTVSGGGKSEISKSIADAILHGPVFTNDITRDFDLVEEIIRRDYGDRFIDPSQNRGPISRPLLSKERSLGSVIKMLTPSSDFTESYNAWLQSIPFYIKDLVFLIKRYYKEDWGDSWRDRFSVDWIDGHPGNEIKYRESYIRSHYLRVGFTEEGNWRTFGLRKDFNPASKVQMEDDISASVVVPARLVKNLNPEIQKPAHKFIQNCEWRLFQRPDDAIHRGFDKTTEEDYSGQNLFFSNYEPLNREQAREIVEDAIRFSKFTKPMQEVLLSFVENTEGPDYIVSSAHPRIVDGAPSKNPRYLQTRTDLTNNRNAYLAELGMRLHRRIAADSPVPVPADSILAGRRCNPPDPASGVKALCCYNPLHFQELPELFMDFIASLTGKSPSTTGAGSEGAMTKGPFNNLPPIVDLNNALVSYLCTTDGCFTSAAGYIGPKYRVDHDISLLVPEFWSRMKVFERDPAYLIANGFLEPCEDFEFEGRLIPASRLGYRITDRFQRHFLGRVLSNPAAVFAEDMLKPELQDMNLFVESIETLAATQERVARQYFEDGSIEFACPPLKALLHIMAEGVYEGKTIDDPEIRNLFTHESMMSSKWYSERLKAQQQRDIAAAEQTIRNLEGYLHSPHVEGDYDPLGVRQRLADAREELARRQKAAYLESLRGTLGLDPILV